VAVFCTVSAAFRCFVAAIVIYIFTMAAVVFGATEEPPIAFAFPFFFEGATKILRPMALTLG